MHLKQLKLAGFKSFLDPVVVYFPSQLVAVVGPNGCGKSNIIDAVRWVMGESSAKNLRGESMSDVIFNGSSQRKPVGQASVELIFDNSLGRLTGPFASYGEIAVKRVVTRAGDSDYFLNGAPCRRKDITDIFLGTGAGTKGYSIIGQGTISRLIEAKPEELRAHLEEAAGVSKYKERRRETLQRIALTRENLTRLADIREELDKQLHRLERQAKAAQRYTQLKEDEKKCRAQIQALKWQDLIKQQQVKQTELQHLALNYEQQQSLLTNTVKQRVQINEKLQDSNEEVQQIQASFYQSGTEIARLEEIIQQQEREKKRLEQDKLQIQADCQRAAEQLAQDKEELLINQKNAEHLKVNLEKIAEEFKENEQEWDEAKKQKLDWESHWQEVSKASTTTKSELHLVQINVQHNEQRRQQTLLKREQIKLQDNIQALADLKATQQELQEQGLYLKEQQAQEEYQVQQAMEGSTLMRTQLQELEHSLRSLQDKFHHKNSELLALIAVQQAALQAQPIDTEPADKPRLVSVLQVEPKWQLACETVLQQSLQAYVVDDLKVFVDEHKTSLVTMRPVLGTQQSFPRLADKMQGLIPSTLPLLEQIFTAENLEEALSWTEQLLAHESIVTADGYWLAQGWIKWIQPAEQEALGLLARQQKITELRPVVQNIQEEMDENCAKRDEDYAQLQQQLTALDELRALQSTNNKAIYAHSNALIINEKSVEQLEHAIKHQACEQEQLQELLEELIAEQLELEQQLSVLEQRTADQQQEYAQLMQDKLTKNAVFEQHDKTRALIQTQWHQMEKEYDRETIKTEQVQNRIVREEERLALLQERAEQITLLDLQSISPQVEYKEQLAVQLMQHTETEVLLALKKEEYSELRLELEHLEQFAYNHDQEVKRVQDLIATARMQEQELSVRANSVQESLDEWGLQAQLLLQELDEHTTQAKQEAELITLTEQIKRLGAINLAAIEEFVQEEQRKLYLDEQHEDLSQALLTLETAIEKMDHETRLRLEHTFDAVNTSFKTLFPRLFGGGKAQLELTCDNLLEAGIVVMAQPPGKRNSTIHLLSGGEKAMTAVALVFAIFQLNPSPFCMLDEVDAPLDDVNVGRFCALVKEMSQFVQFLFITHNKVTMELADHLMGVTMREPGVSRLVAVDVKQALTME